MSDILFYRSELIEFVVIKDKRLCFGEHCHSSSIVLTAVLEGQAELVRNGVPEIKTEGDIFFVLPYENHSLTSQKPVSILSMCVKKQLAGLSVQKYTEIVSAAVNGMTDKGLPTAYAERLINEAETALKAFTEKSGKTEDAMLISERNSIEEHPETAENLDESGRKVYMSKYHFIRRFRELSGLTPHKFRIQNRVRMAQKQLSEGVPISEAALMAGFYDQSHFDRYFKKIVGVSPKDYVDSLRNFLQE